MRLEMDPDYGLLVLSLVFLHGNMDYQLQMCIYHVSLSCRFMIAKNNGIKFPFEIIHRFVPVRCDTCKEIAHFGDESIYGGKHHSRLNDEFYGHLARPESQEKLVAILNRCLSTYRIGSFLLWLMQIGPDPSTLATVQCVYRFLICRKIFYSERDWGEFYTEFRRRMRNNIHPKWMQLFYNRNALSVIPLLEAGAWGEQKRPVHWSHTRPASEAHIEKDSSAKRMKQEPS